MTPGAVRGAVIVVCVGGIAGMIIGSVADNNAVALTFGLVTAAAVACLIVVTAVSAPTADAVSTAARPSLRTRDTTTTPWRGSWWNRSDLAGKSGETRLYPSAAVMSTSTS